MRSAASKSTRKARLRQLHVAFSRQVGDLGRRSRTTLPQGDSMEAPERTPLGRLGSICRGLVGASTLVCLFVSPTFSP